MIVDLSASPMPKALLYLVVAIMAIVLVVMPDLPWVLHKDLDSRWLPSTATVSNVRVEMQSETVAKKQWQTRIVYTYVVNGSAQLGVDIENNHETFPASHSAEEIRNYKLKRFPIGSVHAIRYSSFDPTESYIRDLHTRELGGVLIGSVLAIACTAAAVWAFLRRNRTP